jgi:hypothetical protein
MGIPLSLLASEPRNVDASELFFRELLAVIASEAAFKNFNVIALDMKPVKATIRH